MKGFKEYCGTIAEAVNDSGKGAKIELIVARGLRIMVNGESPNVENWSWNEGDGNDFTVSTRDGKSLPVGGMELMAFRFGKPYYELKKGDEIVVETAQGNYSAKIVKEAHEVRVKLLNGKTMVLDETQSYILIHVIGKNVGVNL